MVWRLGSGPPPADAVPSSSSSEGTGRGSLPAPGPPFVAARWGTRGPALPDVGVGSSRPGQDEARGLPPDRLVQSLPRRRPENCWQPSGTWICSVGCASWTTLTSAHRRTPRTQVAGHHAQPGLLPVGAHLRQPHGHGRGHRPGGPPPGHHGIRRPQLPHRSGPAAWPESGGEPVKLVTASGRSICR